MYCSSLGLPCEACSRVGSAPQKIVPPSKAHAPSGSRCSSSSSRPSYLSQLTAPPLRRSLWVLARWSFLRACSGLVDLSSIFELRRLRNEQNCCVERCLFFRRCSPRRFAFRSALSFFSASAFPRRSLAKSAAGQGSGQAPLPVTMRAHGPGKWVWDNRQFCMRDA